jgi:hypothetical protein
MAGRCRSIALKPGLNEAWRAAPAETKASVEVEGAQMIEFSVGKRLVTLDYEPEFVTAKWVHSELASHGNVTISRAFTFERADLLAAPPVSDEEDVGPGVFSFRFAANQEGYFQIPGRILGVSCDVLIDNAVWLERKLFVAERNVGIFRRIVKAVGDKREVVVGGQREDRIPIEVFRALQSRFPNSGELDRYANARVDTIIGEYFDGMRSARQNYEAYLSRRKSSVTDRPLAQQELLQTDIDKFVYVRDTIADWLKEAEGYSERDWQRMIVKVILLIFPKYVAVLEGVQVADFYTTPGTAKPRYIDLCLVDAAGNIDVIEIKKPFNDVILARTLYRDNSIPTRELSGSIMQAEKYLFHLSKWGVQGERELSLRHGAELPPGMKIKVTNPKAIIILGRDRMADGGPALSDRQRFDLEVIKRKYANMIDILTYDDLLRRLDNIIASLSRRKEDAEAGHHADSNGEGEKSRPERTSKS